MKLIKKFLYLATSMVFILKMDISPAFMFGLGKRVVGDGTIVTETRKLLVFNSIHVRGMNNVVIKMGKKTQVVVNSDQNVLPYLQTFVRDKVLYIREAPGVSVSPSKENKFIVTAKNLRKVSTSGSNKVFIPNISADYFTLNVDGSSRVLINKFKINKNAKVNMSGSTKGYIVGNANKLQVKIKGDGNFLMEKLKADNVVLKTSGSSRCKLSGTANKLQVKTSSSSILLAKDLLANAVDLDMEGSSKAFIHADQFLKMRLSGSSKVQYYGDPSKISQDISGSARILKMKN